MASSSTWTISNDTLLGRQPQVRRFCPASNRDRLADGIAQKISKVIAGFSSRGVEDKAGNASDNTPHTTDQDGYVSLVTIAREAGVEQFVYTSFPPLAASFPLQDAKRAVERALRASGLTYTILQPTYFTEIWLSPAVGFDYPNGKAVIYGTGDNPISWISFRDVAQFAAPSVNNPLARNVTVELGGPQGISPSNVIKIFERISGKSFDVTYVAVETLQGQLAGATDPMQKSYAGLMLGYTSQRSIAMAATLKTFPLTLRTVEDYARSVLPS
jgi:uncharacterized protein YbjT (DUF2867 family)